ncbi:MAG: DUF3526 domain-containing protein [Blastocatellia bacterium]|nr:DUF3526 domain-containing protein [Blastocatellia bacterium]
MNRKRLLPLELKNFLTGRAVLLGLLVIFLAGVYAIEHGRRIIAAQQNVLNAAPELQRAHFEKVLAAHPNTPAGAIETLYYLNHFTRHEPSRFAPLSIGLREVNPYNLKVRMLALEGQLYNSDISNPATLALGNFDLSFLLVFLYPLLLIAFTHNTLSAEQEQGTWNLICAQPTAPRQLLWLKAGIRGAALIAVWLLTLLVSLFWLRLPLDRRFGFITLISLAYLLFWFATSLFVMSLRRSSNFNALALLGVWLTLTILVPAALNVGMSVALPVPEALAVTVNQREGYHAQWDRPKPETMQRFFQTYPEYASFQVPLDKFSYGWYYAAQHLGDVEAAKASAQYRAKLRQRQQWTRVVAWMLPTITTHSAFNEIAQTELENHLAYLDSVRSFHEQVCRFFYPFLMRNDTPPPVPWDQLPRHRFSDEAQKVSFPFYSLSLLTLSFGLMGLAMRRMRHRVSS